MHMEVQQIARPMRHIQIRISLLALAGEGAAGLGLAEERGALPGVCRRGD